jgi:chemotaxis protein MotB
MHARGVRRTRAAEEEESYFISMADMMVGLLFVFIILLMYFALQFQQKSKALSDAGEARAQLLKELQADLARHNLKVEIDTATGVLRLPAAILFASGSYALSDQGKQAVGLVANSMATVLPCYTQPRRVRGCAGTPHSIDAIFIEGHTDTDRLSGAGSLSDNLDLSALRATNTYRAMQQAAPSVGDLLNRDSRPILSVSGYGADRPVASGGDEAAKSRNRRIDLRFLMETPKSDALTNLLADDA